MKIEKDAPKRERRVTAPTHETHTTLDAFQSVLFVEIFGYKNSTGQRKYGKSLNKKKRFVYVVITGVRLVKWQHIHAYTTHIVAGLISQNVVISNSLIIGIVVVVGVVINMNRLLNVGSIQFICLFCFHSHNDVNPCVMMVL